MSKDCFVIPTYWSVQGVDSWKIFDHPTPIEEDGTIQRTLENFDKMDIKYQFYYFQPQLIQESKKK